MATDVERRVNEAIELRGTDVGAQGLTDLRNLAAQLRQELDRANGVLAGMQMGAGALQARIDAAFGEVAGLGTFDPRPAPVAPRPAVPGGGTNIQTPNVKGFRQSRGQVAADISRDLDFGRRNR